MEKSHDIQISIVNDTHGYKYIDIWNELKKNEVYIDLYKRYRKKIIIGSILFGCMEQNFIYSNSNLVLDKIYDLKHYKKQGSDYEALIYDFQKGYLSPMKYKPDLETPCYLTVPSNSSLSISLSLYEE